MFVILPREHELGFLWQHIHLCVLPPQSLAYYLWRPFQRQKLFQSNVTLEYLFGTHE